VVSAADLYGRNLGFLGREQERLNTAGIEDVGAWMSHNLTVLNVQSQLQLCTANIAIMSVGLCLTNVPYSCF
jgi:hypothetical protein